jgi:hypothetical protein
MIIANDLGSKHPLILTTLFIPTACIANFISGSIPTINSPAFEGSEQHKDLSLALRTLRSLSYYAQLF